MTKTAAVEKVLESMDWQMKVVCGEKEQALENLLKENVEKVVDEAFKKGESADYEIPTDGLEEAAAAQGGISGRSLECKGEERLNFRI